METEENPFRPERPLYHEVDPIVEKYKTKSGAATPDPVSFNFYKSMIELVKS